MPFTERGGRVRGVLDLVCGRYPRFLFGAGVGTYLPVFHFHEVTADELEPHLRYLAENRYTTVTSDEIAQLVLNRRHPGPRTVALAFDDGHATFWTVAAPLLRRYGMRAILYAIPGRMEEADTLRPTMEEDRRLTRHDPPGPRYVTWPELKALHDSGVADVQSHTWSHSLVFCSRRLVGFVGPDYARTLWLNRPLVSDSNGLEWARPDVLGTPIYAHRSRMSDCTRFYPDPAVVAACRKAVTDGGGERYFSSRSAIEELEATAARGTGRMETAAERERAILDELVRSREVLNQRLGTTSVRHICLPWGVGGRVTLDALHRTGYVTAFSNRLRGAMAVSAGDHPYRLKRLSNRFIPHLPGRGRRLDLRDWR